MSEKRPWRVGDRVRVDLGDGVVQRIDGDGDLIIVLDRPRFIGDPSRSLFVEPGHPGLTYQEPPLPKEPESNYVMRGMLVYRKKRTVNDQESIWIELVTRKEYTWEEIVNGSDPVYAANVDYDNPIVGTR